PKCEKIFVAPVSHLLHLLIRLIQSPHANPSRAVNTLNINAISISFANWAPVSPPANLYGSYRIVAGSKYAKYAIPKMRFRAAGDIKKSANGHCTAINDNTNSGPVASASFHLPHELVLRHNTSITIAGTINRSGKCSGIRCVMCW